jgi:hypothetical protein
MGLHALRKSLVLGAAHRMGHVILGIATARGSGPRSGTHGTRSSHRRCTRVIYGCGGCRSQPVENRQNIPCGAQTRSPGDGNRGQLRQPRPTRVHGRRAWFRAGRHRSSPIPGGHRRSGLDLKDRRTGAACNTAQAPLVVLNIGAVGPNKVFAYRGGQVIDVTSDGGQNWYRALFKRTNRPHDRARPVGSR